MTSGWIEDERTSPLISIPEEFASSTVAREGQAGRAWLDALPTLVARLCRQWHASIDGPALHGYLSLVVPVRHDGDLAVLKISWPDESTAGEAAALACWNGQGAVRLLEVEPALSAMLLERLDYSHTLQKLPIAEALRIAGRLLRRLAIAPPDGVRPLSDVALEVARRLPARWERHGRPVAAEVLGRACDLARQLGASAGELLVNHDLHYSDVLAGQREPWLVVDPKVVAGDLEYGPAQLLWTRLEEIEAQGGLDRHFALLVEAADLDDALARSWTLVRTLDYWLWALGAGLTRDPARCARIVTWLV